MIYKNDFFIERKVSVRDASNLDKYKGLVFYKYDLFLDTEIIKSFEGIAREEDVKDIEDMSLDLRGNEIKRLKTTDLLKNVKELPMLFDDYVVKGKNVLVINKKEYDKQIKEIYGLDSVWDNSLVVDTDFSIEFPYSSGILLDDENYNLLMLSSYSLSDFSLCYPKKVLSKVWYVDSIYIYESYQDRLDKYISKGLGTREDFSKEFYKGIDSLSYVDYDDNGEIKIYLNEEEMYKMFKDLVIDTGRYKEIPISISKTSYLISKLFKDIGLE